jgi:hypothetical protein
LKVIFLDVDGVLNSRGKWAGCDLANLTDSGTRIDPLAVARLKRIVDATDAKIVVSSTWRLTTLTTSGSISGSMVVCGTA